MNASCSARAALSCAVTPWHLSDSWTTDDSCVRLSISPGGAPSRASDRGVVTATQTARHEDIDCAQGQGEWSARKHSNLAKEIQEKYCKHDKLRTQFDILSKESYMVVFNKHQVVGLVCSECQGWPRRLQVTAMAEEDPWQVRLCRLWIRAFKLRIRRGCVPAS